MQVGTIIILTFYNSIETSRGLIIANSSGTAKATYSETAIGTYTKQYTVVAGDGLAGSYQFKIKRNNNSYLVGLTVANCAPLYTVTLDKNGGATDGAATVSGGDNALNVSSVATRVGYFNLLGYYDAASGGNKVAEANGTLVANVTGFTDGSGNWTATENKTLYAHWLSPMSTLTEKWSIDFTSISSTEYSESTFGSTYYNLVDGEENALNDNFGVPVKENEGKNSFYIYGGALYSFYGGDRNIAFNNLEVGEILRLTCSSVPNSASSGLTLLSDYCNGNVYIYQVKTAGIQTIKIPRYTYIYKVEVLNFTNEVVGALDYSTGANEANSSDYTMKPGDTKVFTFQNHGKDYGKNWRIAVKEGETWKANVCADSYDYTADAATKVSYKVSKDGGSSRVLLDWTEFEADMADARVVATLAYGLDGTLAITTTSTGTANDYIYYVDQDVTGLSGDLTINLSVNNSWLEILSVTQTAVGGTIASSGYSSLGSAYGLNFSSATGLTAAYVVTNITNSTVTLTSVDELPASSGVILKGIANASYSIPVKADAVYGGTNKLYAAVTGYDCDANEVYILQSGLFHLVTAASTVPAGKAYLKASDVPNAARSLSFLFSEDETTGINAVNHNLQNSDFFNLQGQRVDTPRKGLYIVNGKKVIVK